ncbi:MAG: prolipoprotein diacylglyceryl transferase [Ahrensia sp.]|nr:prolipoprotein diacylglyceryl transferase [Ahrensia sp.]
MHPFAAPGLAIAFPQIDPVIFSIGPLAVHWYGLAYVTGILLGWQFAKRVVANQSLWPGTGSPIRTVEIDDFLTWAVVGIIAGGRLGYVLFYNLPVYLADPLSIFAIWDGGMSFHGGAVGSIVAMVLFARSRGFSAFSLLDVVAAASCFGLFFGRLANFINSELWGRPTDVPWAVVFPNGGNFPRHPSQLYEAALEGLLLFFMLAALIYWAKKLRHPGFIGGSWVFGYGLSRIIVEFFREPDAQLGYLYGDWLTMGMVLSLPMLLVGAWGMATASLRAAWRAADDEDEQSERSQA